MSAVPEGASIPTDRSPRPRALVMAGGTGGHIFPGLAVAAALQDRGWRVHWLGTPESMESRLVPPQGFAFEAIDFGGVRGKGWRSLWTLPARLLRALVQTWRTLDRVQPNVVVGFGGYVTAPGGATACLRRIPLVLHEQNAIAGLANRALAPCARHCFTAFPDVLPRGVWVGNPLRAPFWQQPEPRARFAGRSGPLRVLVVGGSLGARALNETVPQALARLDPARRPSVLHQSGEKQFEALQDAYAQAGVQARLVAFIDDMAHALADADLVIARAGASTVTEIAAIGAAAVFVPFPHAVDDHQTHNARFLVERGGGWLMNQTDFTPERLAAFLAGLDRAELLRRAEAAHAARRAGATEAIVNACERLLEPQITRDSP